MTSEDIKEYCLSIGYDKVGITTVDCLSGYVDEVLSRGDPYSFFIKSLTKPVHNKMPGAKSIIVVIKDYFNMDFPETLRQMIGKIYLSRCYGAPPGTLEYARLQLVKDYLEKNGCAAHTGVYVPARWVAAQSGLTTFGRNNFAYADGIGSYIVIHSIVVDRVFAYDQATMENKCPPHCRACMNACPTKALYEPFRLDPRKCIAFNNWMTQDGRGSVSSFISYEIREQIGCKIHGCDICQDVCPRNQKKLQQPKPVDQYLEQIEPDISLSAMLNMPDDFYQRRIKPILYNYISDKRYFMRNAAIAMGNSQDECHIGDLETALDNSDMMVKEYAVWALGRIGGQRAKAVLEKCRIKETSENMKQIVGQTLSNF